MLTIKDLFEKYGDVPLNEDVMKLFGINEPVLFGVTIVMNPMLAVPFIGMPVIACLIQYFAFPLYLVKIERQ